MKTISLTLIQRFGLVNVLGQQEGKYDDKFVLYSVRHKCKLTRDEKQKYMVATSQGLVLDEDRAEDAPLTPVEFETEEVRQLLNFFKDATVRVAWLDWWHPLKEELERK